MTAKANSFGQRTFDFIEGLDRLDTPEAVLGTMVRVVGLHRHPAEAGRDIGRSDPCPSLSRRIARPLRQSGLCSHRSEHAPRAAFLFSLRLDLGRLWRRVRAPLDRGDEG